MNKLETPAVASAPAPASGPDETVGISSGHNISWRVLVVEDERRLREMLISTATELGFVAEGTSTAEAALRLASQSPFAIALVDLNLPGIGGLEFCRLLRERREQLPTHMQAVILTGFGDLQAARQAIDLEVVSFLLKPASMAELEAALSRARARWLEWWRAQLQFDPSAEAAPADNAHARHTASKSATSRAARSDSETSLSPETAVAAQNEKHPPAASAASSATSIDPPAGTESMETMERHLILSTLAREGGSRQATAAALGISVRKLYYRLRQYDREGYSLGR